MMRESDPSDDMTNGGAGEGHSPEEPGADLHDAARAALDDALTREPGRVLSVLIRSLRDFDLAEDALQDAVTVALERWPAAGVPENPAGWLVTTARRRAIDRLRRSASWQRNEDELRVLRALEAAERQSPEADSSLGDERLRLIFTCLPSRARARGTRRADPAHRRRAQHGRGRARVPHDRRHHEEAARASEAANSQRGDPVQRAFRRAVGGADRWGARRPLSDLQRGIPVPRARRRNGAKRGSCNSATASNVSTSSRLQ